MLYVMALLVLLAQSSLGMHVDYSVHAHLLAKGAADVMIYLAAPLDIEHVNLAGVTDRRARRELVHRHLVAQTDAAQQGLRTTLGRMGMPFQAFWIANAIAVRALSGGVLRELPPRNRARARPSLNPVPVLLGYSPLSPAT